MACRNIQKTHATSLAKNSTLQDWLSSKNSLKMGVVTIGAEGKWQS